MISYTHIAKRQPQRDGLSGLLNPPCRFMYCRYSVFFAFVTAPALFPATFFPFVLPNSPKPIIAFIAAISSSSSSISRSPSSSGGASFVRRWGEGLRFRSSLALLTLKDMVFLVPLDWPSGRGRVGSVLDGESDRSWERLLLRGDAERRFLSEGLLAVRMTSECANVVLLGPLSSSRRCLGSPSSSRRLSRLSRSS